MKNIIEDIIGIACVFVVLPVVIVFFGVAFGIAG